MFGLLINLSLILLAAKSCNKGRRLRLRNEQLEGKAEEREREWSDLNDHFQLSCRNLEAAVGERAKGWAAQVNLAKERTNATATNLRREMAELENELADFAQLELGAAQRRVDVLEEQRFAFREQIALREARIAELRNAVEGRPSR